MNIPVLVNQESEHLGRFQESVDIVNNLQRSFRLFMTKVDWLPDDLHQVVDTEDIRRTIEDHFHNEPTITVIENAFQDAYFSHEYRRSFIITVADWEEVFAPPPLKIYLAYQFAGALLNFAADLPQEMIDKWWHEPPTGCFFDFCHEKHAIRLGMVGANICGDCEVKLSGMGLPDHALESVEQILSFVRSAAIRRPRAMPSHIFIGHGRSNTWLELKTYLTSELGLTIEEFNQEATAGVATTERLQEMLNRACFAFLVMTAEDEHADNKTHARENVVHEIGLFQGRLGFRKAIILKEERCAPFSNIHGLTYIAFKRKKFSKTKKKIRQTLEREGIIEPSHSTASVSN